MLASVRNCFEFYPNRCSLLLSTWCLIPFYDCSHYISIFIELFLSDLLKKARYGCAICLFLGFTSRGDYDRVQRGGQSRPQ